MSLLSRLFGRSRSESDDREGQAVLVHLDGTSLPDEIYEQYDTMSLEGLLTDALEEKGLGAVDGSETGPTETTVFMYGPDAERIFAGIEKVLRSYPLCRNARVVIRTGPIGGPEREVRIPAA